MKIQNSELILSGEGRIYHLNIGKENIASTIILVGDPERVPVVSAHFDSVEFTAHKREFVTHTGTFQGKRLSVVSTGIGTDNIDIVLNEIDALFNIDLEKRAPKEQITPLKFIRLGTSGSLQAEIPVDSIVLSAYGLGMDCLLHSYKDSPTVREADMEKNFITHSHWNMDKGHPYIVACGELLSQKLYSPEIFKGITGTAPGFYAPQGRKLRLTPEDEHLNEKLHSFCYNGYKVTNMEMETAAIYGLSKLLGHQAVSLNAIIANRPTGTFTADTKKAVEKLIEYALPKIAASI
ncbi:MULTISPECIES: nucleoside phosphorylase [unclassified Capnocytophaga]|jgi:Uridine phosphorylase|uniref:nucleoside phosphorylase n=1 Tax=unclassified Capnocytophaga TaxID=2640652 RepID=UPI000202F7E3|nr:MULTISPECIES: nucleoside phosphorylase [unclassified Capnocytophaga]EGD35299.1 phosphorylase [Capnocytophaga sp. oral taxon 338 str. F0234]MEB3005370.1 nucleoside phosphorylase [Capnocytophaga sp. G2]